MKNYIFTILALFSYSITYSQVGINTPAPQTTLDIAAKSSTGNSSEVDGILVPRIDRLRAQSMNNIPESTLVYINSIANGLQTGTTANVDAVGYYYFSNGSWVKLGQNIYTTDGNLSEDRTVALNGKKLTFSADKTVNAFSVDGSTFSIDTKNKNVGIGTSTPTATMDVNGTIRIGSSSDGTSDSYLLTMDTDGIINKIDKTTLTTVTEYVDITVNSQQTVLFYNLKGYQSSNIIITSANSCNRTMIASFQSNLGALTFLNGIARDILAKSTVTTIPAGQQAYSTSWTINFPSVITCGSDGGNGTQFDFFIKKEGPMQYTFTNLGNVTRSYRIIFQKI